MITFVIVQPPVTIEMVEDRGEWIPEFVRADAEDRRDEQEDRCNRGANEVGPLDVGGEP